MDIHKFSYSNINPVLPIQNPIPTIKNLKDKFLEKMINEMVDCIKKHNPNATEEEIVLKIINGK